MARRESGTLARRDQKRAEQPDDPERQQQYRQLERHQRRHIAARHVGREDQNAAEQFSPGLFEKAREIFRSLQRIERRLHRPRPNHRHHCIGENQTGEQPKQQLTEAERRCFRTGGPRCAASRFDDKDQSQRRQEIERTQHAQHA
jgi:hypothetical protein